MSIHNNIRFLVMAVICLIASPAMGSIFQHRTLLYTNSPEFIDVVFVECDSAYVFTCHYKREQSARIFAGRYADHMTSGVFFDRLDSISKFYAGIEVVRAHYKDKVSVFPPGACRDVNQLPNYRVGQKAFSVNSDNTVACMDVLTPGTPEP